MKNLLMSLVFSAVLLTGCVSSEVKGTVERQAARGDNMVGKIAAEKTTRKEEQAYINAMRVVWWSLNHDLNDAKLPRDVKELLEKLKLLKKKKDD